MAVHAAGSRIPVISMIMAGGTNGHLIIGDANEAVDKILEMHELFGLTRFSAHMDVGGPSHASLMKSIEIFGTKIAPKVREAIKK